MTEPVRVGVIGTGTLGLRHCRTLALRTPGAELAATADSDENAARTAASLSPSAYAASDHQALLADSSIQAVVIAAPNDVHAQLIREAAEAGKDIFCEKPIGLDFESVDSALDAVSRHQVKLQIGFQRRFDSAYIEARRALSAGELGDVELLVGTTRDPAPPSASYLARSGNIFVDLAIHDYDSLRFLTGLEATEVYATASSLIPAGGDHPAALDTAVTSLRLNNGALAVITSSRRSNYGYDVRVEVSGSKGKVALGEERQTAIRTYTGAGVTHDFVGSYWQLFERAYVAELQHFVECVARDREPEVTGQDGRKALEIALLAERSAREGRPLALAAVI